MSIGELWNSLLSGLGALLSFFYDLIPNYGVAIILLTVAVRVAMIPLTIKQTRSMQEMSRIQPELLRLRAKHKGDRQKLTEETMKLYKEHGVNPYGGCLPLILQMPVFFALFQVFQRCGVSTARGKCPPGQVGVGLLPKASALAEAIQAQAASTTFLGMHLSVTPLQAYREQGLIASIPYFILILAMSATMFYQQKQMTARQQPDEVPPQMQMMTRIMPVMLGVFSLNFPVALTIYWVTSNLWTIGQQYFMIQRKPGPGRVAKRDPGPTPTVGPALPATGNAGGSSPPNSPVANPSGGTRQGPPKRSRNSASRRRRKRRRRR